MSWDKEEKESLLKIVVLSRMRNECMYGDLRESQT